MKTLQKLLTKQTILAGAIGLVLGVLIVLGVRFATYSPNKEHYHANFAVYINGKQEKFAAKDYYEETASATCSADPTEEEKTPMSRVHMHDSVNDVAHVEDTLVTWGNFFTVLGWGTGNNYLATRTTVYQNNATSTVTYILNGKKVDSIANRLIGDQDTLLVNYGNQTAAQIQAEYAAIQNKAAQEDTSTDPIGCGSNTAVPMSERFMHLF